MAVQATDSNELAQFGYKQELDRSLGSFSRFAAGFSYISILTGVFQLFAFGFGSAGPAICGRGRWCSSARWPSRCASRSWRASIRSRDRSTTGRSSIGSRSRRGWPGWLMLVGSIVTVAAVVLAYQLNLPQIWTCFQIIGDGDAGTYDFGGAKNAVLLGAVLIVFTTIVNMIGVKLMARINNVGRVHRADRRAC